MQEAVNTIIFGLPSSTHSIRYQILDADFTPTIPGVYHWLMYYILLYPGRVAVKAGLPHPELLSGLIFTTILLVLACLWGKSVGWWHRDTLTARSPVTQLLVWLFALPGLLVALLVGLAGGFILVAAVVGGGLLLLVLVGVLSQVGEEAIIGEDRYWLRQDIEDGVRRGMK